MAGPTDVLLARHGETDDNAAARFQGHRDPPLNDRGREQAGALARAVADEGIAALWASPLSRARETAVIVAAVLELPIRFDERFMEIDVGDWSGRTHADVAVEVPDAMARWHASDPSFRFPGGESPGELELRVADGLRDVRARALPALVVCHGGVIRAARGHGAAGEAVANGSVHRL